MTVNLLEITYAVQVLVALSVNLFNTENLTYIFIRKLLKQPDWNKLAIENDIVINLVSLFLPRCI